MLLSATNSLEGDIAAVREGAVNGVVVIDVGSSLVKAGITMESIREMGLAEGVRASAVFKASDVMLAVGEGLRVAACDRFPGIVSRVARGAVDGVVHLATDDGLDICATVSCEAIDELGLEPGTPAMAIVKTSDVMVATA